MSMILSLWGDSSFAHNGKKIYESITNTVKSSINIISEEENKSIPTTVVSSVEREKFVKKQFISKKELLGVKEVKKEDISVAKEAVEFFSSLNAHKKKPIDIE